MLGDVGKRMVVSPDIWQLMSEGGMNGLSLDAAQGRGNQAGDAADSNAKLPAGTVGPAAEDSRGASPEVEDGAQIENTEGEQMDEDILREDEGGEEGEEEDG